MFYGIDVEVLNKKEQSFHFLYKNNYNKVFKFKFKLGIFKKYFHTIEVLLSEFNILIENIHFNRKISSNVII